MVQPEAFQVTQGSGFPVIFAHGMGVDHRSLMMLDDCFPDGLQRIYVDLAGFGRTPALPKPGGLPELARWFHETVDGLVGPDAAFALVGNSMGGALARDVLACDPRRVKGLALIAPVVDPRRARRRVAEHVVAEPNPDLMARLPQEQVLDFIEMGVNQSFDAWRRYQRFIMPGVRLSDHDACLHLDERYWMDRDPEQAFGTFDGPTLIVTGEYDQIVGFEDQKDLLAHYPNAEYAVVANAGHNVHIDRPDEVRDLVRRWAMRLSDALRQAA